MQSSTIRNNSVSAVYHDVMAATVANPTKRGEAIKNTVSQYPKSMLIEKGQVNKML